MSPPAAPLSLHQLGSVQVAWPADVGLVAALLLYVVGVARLARSEGDPWPWPRTAAFLGGLAAVAVALDSVLGAYDDVLFADHIAQHLVLVMVAAPLLAMGAPVELARRATGGRLHRAVTAALRSRPAEVVGHPLLGFGLCAVAIPVGHLTGLYDVTLTNVAVHGSEHVVLLAIGYLFWRPVVAVEPSRHPLTPGARVLYLVLALPITACTGLALSSADHELFPVYLTMHRPWGPSRLGDLHDGGRILWIGGDAVLLGAVGITGARWLRAQRRPSWAT